MGHIMRSGRVAHSRIMPRVISIKPVNWGCPPWAVLRPDALPTQHFSSYPGFLNIVVCRSPHPAQRLVCKPFLDFDLLIHAFRSARVDSSADYLDCHVRTVLLER